MNAHTHKRASLIIVISLLVLSTLSILSMQSCPVSAQTSDAVLTGTIYDSGVDTDDDGLFNFLEIGVQINVSTAGTYDVDVTDLYDADYNLIDLSNRSSKYFDVGIHVFDIYLDGEVIYNSGINPTSVALIDLYTDTEDPISTEHDIPLSEDYTYTDFQTKPVIIDYKFNEIEREIILGHGKSIRITNIYTITNLGDNILNIEFGIPDDASNIKLRDEMGNLEVSEGFKTITVNLRENLYTNQTVMLYVSYYLPWETYVTPQNGVNYSLDFTFYEEFDWTIGELTVSIILPEGAEFQSSNPSDYLSVQKGGLKDTVTFAFSDVTPEDDLNFEISYRYLMFWSSFYPTIWVGVLVVIVSAVAFLWKAPAPVAAPIIPVPPENIRRFVDVYEEKARIKSELESMEERLRKGKISRRRFKIRKRMLDGRLSTISRDLSSLHEKIRVAGHKYANMMRQIEVAENNLEGAVRDIQRVKARYRRGEVSKGAYGKLMDEYNRRSEEAEATIDGVLLRLREEIR
ncbi:MAG: hypothetical protein JSW14_01280 [Candidatus Bathyarchaeum sp.]|nr:MAG: hypothetical protein JSW14_01280 [Candidatus Bathyarchaeum sp.]